MKFFLKTYWSVFLFVFKFFHSFINLITKILSFYLLIYKKRIVTYFLIFEEKFFQLNPDALKKDPTNLTVILHGEDHTIGNSLKHILCKMLIRNFNILISLYIFIFDYLF